MAFLCKNKLRTLDFDKKNKVARCQVGVTRSCCCARGATSYRGLNLNAGARGQRIGGWFVRDGQRTGHAAALAALVERDGIRRAVVAVFAVFYLL